MQSSIPKYYCDSCIFIDFLDDCPKASDPEGPEKHKRAFDLFKRAQRRELSVYTSTFTLAEVCKFKPTEGISDDDQEQRIKALFSQRWILKINYERKIAEVSRGLSRQFGIKPHDSIHLASALRMDADFLYTTDKRFLKKATQYAKSDTSRHLKVVYDPGFPIQGELHI